MVNQNTDARNYGIDFLRMLAMFMVVILHVLKHGGVLGTVDLVHDAKYNVAWLFEVWAYCAVDCFGIITGYVSYGKKYKVSRYFHTWIQVSFISFLISAVFFSFHRIGLGTFAFSWLPVFSRKYWYFSAYTGLFFLMPIINVYIENVDDKELCRLLSILTIGLMVYSPLSTYMYRGDMLPYGGGYSILWLVMLYLIGVCLRRFPIRKLNTRWLVTYLFIIICIGWLIQIKGSPILGEVFLTYESPVVLIQAIIWVCLAERFHFPETGNRIIHCLAPSAFSVYLIHEHPLIKEMFIYGRFGWIGEKNLFVEVLLILGISIGIYVSCLLLDISIRRSAFRWLRVYQRIDAALERLCITAWFVK